MKPRSTPPRPGRKSSRPDEAASRLQETEELLALAQEAGRIGIFEWQVQTGVVRLSPRFLSLYGLTEFDGRYESWLKCIFREDVPRITDLFDTAFAARAGSIPTGCALNCSFALGSRPAGKAMSDEDMKAELDRLRNENAALKKGASSSLRLKVSEKGALSVYGMGRFPVTLYKEQWLKLLGVSDEIRAFIAANDAQLKAKD